MSRLTGAGLFLLALGAAGCNADEPTTPTSEPLREIDIPEDFTFSMTQGVQLRVQADAELDFFAPLSVQVNLPSGDTLYRGPVVAGEMKMVEVVTPKATQELVVRLEGRSKEIARRVPVSAGVVEVELR